MIYTEQQAARVEEELRANIRHYSREQIQELYEDWSTVDPLKYSSIAPDIPIYIKVLSEILAVIDECEIPL